MTSLAMFTVAIVSPTNAAKWGTDAFKNPCGTGPFKFVEWVKDDHITVEAFKEYRRGAPKLDKVIYRVIIDPSARLLALQAGEVHAMESPDPASFNAIQARDNLHLLTKECLTVGYIAMNIPDYRSSRT